MSDQQTATTTPKKPTNFQEPKKRPEGIRNVEYQKDIKTITFELKTAKHFWWYVSPILAGIIAVVALIASPILALSFDDPFDRSGPAYLSFFLVALIGGIALIWLSFSSTRPWIKIEGTPDYIRVREGSTMSKTYRREHFGGMATSYTIKTPDGKELGTMMEPSFGLTRLRLIYGPWGDDLPYLISSRHSTDLIIWMNLVLDAVDMPSPTAHAPDLGRVEEVF